CRRRSATIRRRRCRSWCWPVHATSRPARCPSASSTALRSTACRWPRPPISSPPGPRSGSTTSPTVRTLLHDADGHPEDTLVDRGAGEPDRLERLWAPYRMHYIADNGASKARVGDGDEGSSSSESRSRNPFVELPERSDEDALIVARGELVYCVLNLYPYNAGHLMVVPYRQVANLEDLTDEEMAELMAFGQRAIRTLKKVSRPHALNVGFN